MLFFGGNGWTLRCRRKSCRCDGTRTTRDGSWHSPIRAAGSRYAGITHAKGKYKCTHQQDRTSVELPKHNRSDSPPNNRSLVLLLTAGRSLLETSTDRYWVWPVQAVNSGELEGLNEVKCHADVPAEEVCEQPASGNRTTSKFVDSPCQVVQFMTGMQLVSSS